MANELSPQEQEAYELLIVKREGVREASKKLAEKGIEMTPRQLRAFKKNLFTRILAEDREERQSEYMLDSFERTKLEFEDLVKNIKSLIERYHKDDDPWKEAALVRQLQDAINTALRVQGRFETTLMKVTAKNVNILSPPDMAQAFKTMQESWFANMGAEIVDGKLVLSNPSPELIDDYNRWQAKEFRMAQSVQKLSQRIEEKKAMQDEA